MYTATPDFQIPLRFSLQPLVKDPQVAHIHIYSLSTRGDRKWAYFRSTDSSFRDTVWFSKLPYLGMELGHWQNIQKLHIYSLSTARGWNWATFALRAAVSETRADFQTCHVWAWNLAIGQSSRNCTYTLFVSQEVEIKLIVTLIWQQLAKYKHSEISKLPYLGMNLAIGKG